MNLAGRVRLSGRRAVVAAALSATMLVALLWSSGTAAAAPARNCGTIAARVNSAERAYMKTFSSGSAAFPGVAIGVVMPGRGGGGAKLASCTYTFGMADQASGRHVTSTTQFEVASLTKLFTATLLARAVSQGRMSLSSPIQDYLPAGARAPSDPACDDAAITIADLATEHSGLIDQPVDYAAAHASYTLARLYTDLRNARLQHCPGVRFGASEFGYGLLGDLIVRAEGAPVGSGALGEGAAYGGLLRGAITKPLGMTRTRLEPLKADPYLATPYGAQDTALAPFTYDIGALAGADGLVSSIGNMERFVEASLGDAPAAQAAWLAATEEPIATGSQVDYRTGLGWQLGTASWYPRSFLLADGISAGMSSYTMLVPSLRLGVVILTNQALSEPSYPVQLIVHSLTPGSKSPPRG